MGGYEWLEGLDLPVAAGRLAREAVDLTGARPCPREVTTVVVDPTMVGMILHETLGHPAELDRALGDELDNFGTELSHTGQVRPSTRMGPRWSR